MMKYFKELQESIDELDRQIEQYRENIKELKEMNCESRKYLISKGIPIPEVPEVA
jgi:peptidoglycan hydrolase CwlO-like protein